MKTRYLLSSVLVLASAIVSLTHLTATAQSQPDLAISRNTTNVTLSWSTNYPDYILESTGSLSGPWTDVADATNATVTLPMVSSNQFFRLKETVSVTYIANEGFLISGRSKKVLIDAIFTEGWGSYYTPPTNVLSQERDATAPFNNINALLITHYHADHLRAAYVNQHLTNDPAAVLIGSLQVSNLLRTASGSQWGQISNRVVTASPAAGSSEQISVGDLDFKVVSVPHEDDAGGTIQNLGFLFSMGGLKFFHPGDPLADALATYQNLNLANEQIDVAFLPRWLFENSTNAQAVIDYLKPGQFVVMHIQIGQSDYYRNLINTLTNLPPFYLMDTQMVTTVFPAK